MSDKATLVINKAYSAYLQNQNIDQALSQILKYLVDTHQEEYSCVIRLDNPDLPNSTWTTLSSLGVFQKEWEEFIQQTISERRKIQIPLNGSHIFCGFPILTNRIFSSLLVIVTRDPKIESLQSCLQAISDFVEYDLEEETRQQIEKNLIEQTYLLAFTENIAKLGHWKIDLKTGKVSLSDEIYRILGLSDDDFKPTLEGLTQLYHPEDQMIAERQIREAMKTHGEFQFELRIHPRLREGMFVKTQGLCPHNKYQPTYTMIGTIQDVTERVIRTNELRENELTLEKLHLITSNNQLNLEEKILSLLQMYSQKFNTPYAILGKMEGNEYEILQAISPDPNIGEGKIFDLSRTYCYHTIREEKPIGFICAEEAPFDANPCHKETGFETFIGAPIFVDSKVFGAISFIDTKKRKEPFTPKDFNLLQIIASWIGIEISREEYQRYLQIEKEKAESASRAKSEFLANMSHELLTPTNGVVGLAHLLAETNLDQKQAELIQGIIRSGDSLTSIVSDILDLSKLESGQILIQKRPFPLLPLIDEIVAEVREMVQTKNVELQFEYDSTIPEMIESDENRLRRILTNLTSNAVKFTEKGEIVIQVHRLPNNQIKFVVQDTGIGVPEDKQKAIFQKFIKADSSTKQRYGGVGLGLALARRLVHLLGGAIGVESTPGDGSTFWFTIEIVAPDSLPISPYLSESQSRKLS